MDLTVNEFVSPGVQLLARLDKSNLGSIRFPAKHGLSEKTLAYSHSVETSNQFGSSPALKGMCIALSVKSDIGILNILRNPGTVLPRSRFGAGSNNGIKGPIVRNQEISFLDALTKAS
jgi:hypothetical protein